MIMTDKLLDSQNVLINGSEFDHANYLKFHQIRLRKTIQKIKDTKSRRVVEVGSHPWAMTAMMVDDPMIEVCATVSAEEVTLWPDDLGVTKIPYHLKTPLGNEAQFNNYSANIERTRFMIEEQPDIVVACEIMDHLVRSPHVMLLNFNQWLPMQGQLIITTPNGSQFSNPLRLKSSTSAYRSEMYERHTFLYSKSVLEDLVSLCGFRILESGYWDVYERQGPSKVYGLLSTIPVPYLQAKFCKTIYIVAEKENSIESLPKTPLAYRESDSWEFISR